MPSQVFLGRETGWLHIVWLHHPHNTNISIGNNTDALRDFEGQLVELSQRIVQVSVIGQFGNYHHKYGWKLQPANVYLPGKPWKTYGIWKMDAAKIQVSYLKPIASFTKCCYPDSSY
jgi:hypothetical protein